MTQYFVEIGCDVWDGDDLNKAIFATNLVEGESLEKVIESYSSFLLEMFALVDINEDQIVPFINCRDINNIGKECILKKMDDLLQEFRDDYEEDDEE